MANTGRLFTALSALAAFLLWGGWAYFVNAPETSLTAAATRLTSALTQGTASFLITLFMVRAVSALFNRLPANAFRLLLPAVITVSLTGSGLAIIHALIGTAKILYTIAPALSVAFLFCLLTAYKLSKTAP